MSKQVQHRNFEFHMVTMGAAGALFVFLPLVVYLLNGSSVATPKASILVCGGLITVMVAGFAALLRLVAPKVEPVIVAVSRVLLIAVVLLTIFPNRTGELSGFGEIASSSGYMPIIKLIAALGMAVWLRWRKPDVLAWLARAALLVVFLITAYAAVIPVSSADRVSRKTGETPPADFTRLGSAGNVIVVIFDCFTGYRMTEVLNEHPELKKELDGFVHYPSALATSLSTPAGIGAILTGDLETAIEIENPRERNGESLNRSFLNDAGRKGMNAGFISTVGIVGSKVPYSYEPTFFVQPPLRVANRIPGYLGFMALSLPRIGPKELGSLAKSGAEWVSARNRNAAKTEWDLLLSLQSETERRALASKLALGHFIDNLHVVPGNGSVLVLHSNLTHPPNNLTGTGSYVTDSGNGYEGTSVFAVRELLRLCQKLRALGVYDSSLIMAISDHGAIRVDDVTMGGKFAAEQPLPVEYNPLMMIKGPGALGPCRESKMSVWLGDVAATVRDYLKVQNPSDATFETRSLLNGDEADRQLNVPIFFRPDEIGYYTALSKWIRRDFRGPFSAYGKVGTVNPEKMLESKAKISLFSGEDQVAKQILKKGWTKDSQVPHRAAIEVNGFLLAKLTAPGIIVVAGGTEGYQKRVFTDQDAAEGFLRSIPTGLDRLVVGLGVPVNRARRIFDQTAVAENEKSTVNFASAAGPFCGAKPRTIIGPGDVRLDVDINP